MDIVTVIQIVLLAVLAFLTIIWWCVFFACHNDALKTLITMLYFCIYGFVNGFNMAVTIIQQG